MVSGLRRRGGLLLPLKLFLFSSALFLFIAISAAAQSNPPAPAPRACGTLYVGREINNPFTARRIMKTSGSATDALRMPEVLEFVARDSAGRVRIERHADAAPNGGDPVVLYTRGGGQINTTRAELNVTTMIFDCPDGKMITLQPGMRIARSSERGTLQPSPSPREHPYSFFFTSLLRHNPTADILAEDLGYKTIEGVDALGIKTTQIGSEDDAWKRKPIRIREEWVSDDLAAMLVDAVIDLQKNMETTSSLTDVRRVEPDASLFQIPAGYRINPTPAEMPFQVGAGKSVALQPKE